MATRTPKTEPAGDLGLLPLLRLAGKAERIHAPEPVARMTNSFGFGGNNCTLLISEHEEC